MVETSDPAKAKSHSCFLHFRGKPEKHPVKYSTQLGPPALVPTCRNEFNIFQPEARLWLPGFEQSHLGKVLVVYTSSSGDLQWRSNSEGQQFLEHRCKNLQMRGYSKVSKWNGADSCDENDTRSTFRALGSRRRDWSHHQDEQTHKKSVSRQLNDGLAGCIGDEMTQVMPEQIHIPLSNFILICSKR